MEVGDKVQVDIAGHKVADATVKSIENGQATLVVPGTIVVMAVRTSLAPEVEVPVEAAEGTQHVLLTDEVVKPEPVVEPAPVQQLPEGVTPPVEPPAAPVAPVEAPVAPAPPVVIDTPPAVEQAATDQ